MLKNIGGAVNCLKLKKRLNMEKFSTSENLITCLQVPSRTSCAPSYFSCQKSRWHLRCGTALLASSVVLSCSCLASLWAELALSLGLWACSLSAIQHAQGIRLRPEETAETYLQGQQCMQTACLHHFWALNICFLCFNINSVGISVVGCFCWWILRRGIAFCILPWSGRE